MRHPSTRGYTFYPILRGLYRQVLRMEVGVDSVSLLGCGLRSVSLEIAAAPQSVSCHVILRRQQAPKNLHGLVEPRNADPSPQKNGTQEDGEGGVVVPAAVSDFLTVAIPARKGA